MQFSNVIEVHFNWTSHPEYGSEWGYYRIGERYLRFRGGLVLCEDIQIDTDEDGKFATFYFEDGTVEHQWNLNKIIEAEIDVYNQVKKHQGDQESSQLPQPSAD